MNIPRKRAQFRTVLGEAPRSALDSDISGLNLEPVSHLVAMEQPWSIERLDAAEAEYRCFLQSVRDVPDEPMVPSRDCDIYWHAHILILELYLKHCNDLFGRPLLHYPFSGHFGDADAKRQSARFARSQRIMADLVDRVFKPT